VRGNQRPERPEDDDEVDTCTRACKKQEIIFETEQRLFGDFKRLSFDTTIGHKFEPGDDIRTPKRAFSAPLTGRAGSRRRMCLRFSGQVPM